MIQHDYVSEEVPYSHCGWLSPLDLVLLYTMIVSRHPKTYLEVGSTCLRLSPALNDRFYSEQYLLAACLLGGGKGLSILSPSYFVSQDVELSSILAPLWTAAVFDGLGMGGNGFWMTTTE